MIANSLLHNRFIGAEILPLYDHCVYFVVILAHIVLFFIIGYFIRLIKVIINHLFLRGLRYQVDISGEDCAGIRASSELTRYRSILTRSIRSPHSITHRHRSVDIRLSLSLLVHWAAEPLSLSVLLRLRLSYILLFPLALYGYAVLWATCFVCSEHQLPVFADGGIELLLKVV